MVAFTLGGIPDVARVRGMMIGVRGDVTFYGVAPLFQVTPDPHPSSFRAFVRIARAGWDKRMLNTTMGSPSHSDPGHVH